MLKLFLRPASLSKASLRGSYLEVNNVQNKHLDGQAIEQGFKELCVPVQNFSKRRANRMLPFISKPQVLPSDLHSTLWGPMHFSE